MPCAMFSAGMRLVTNHIRDWTIAQSQGLETYWTRTSLTVWMFLDFLQRRRRGSSEEQIGAISINLEHSNLSSMLCLPSRSCF